MTGGFAGAHATLDGLGCGDGLRDGEGHRDVDAHSAGDGILDRLDAGLGRRDLDDDVVGEAGEVLRLVGERLGVAMQAGVGLHGEPPVATLVRLEGGVQQIGGFERDLLDNLPADLGLTGRGQFIGELADAALPAGEVVLDARDGDDWIAGRPDPAPGDRLRQLLGIGGVIPESADARVGHPLQG